MYSSLLTYIAIAILLPAKGKLQDTIPAKGLEEVVVTATRTERMLGGLSVPVSVISKDVIRRSGSLRLSDILSEQTGLAVVQGFGRGIQMQGLSPDYTLILIDGEPLIGRMSGVLDLSRVSVGNIQKIEMVKGPSSSLYGSEALAGVVNIITDGAGSKRFRTDIRYGRFQTADLAGEGSYKWGKLNISGFVNRNASEGYNLLPNAVQKTVEPFRRSTGHFQIGYALAPQLKFRLGVRATEDNIENSILVQNRGLQILSKGYELNRDLNISPSLNWKPGDKLQVALRTYLSRYSSQQVLDAGQVNAYADRFRQVFARIESQADYRFSDRLQSTAGLGLQQETVNSNRYDSLSMDRVGTNHYFFLQQELQASSRTKLVAGLRFDRNSLFSSVWSPKFSMHHRLGERWRLQASIGRGFKAPDFRQLYLNYTNLAAGGYMVFGTLVAADEMRRLIEAGQIAQVLPVYEKLTMLKPETSTGINAGFRFQATKDLTWNLNLFRNEIGNLILTDIIAFRNNGGQIFSYVNVNRAFTQGIESNLEQDFESGLRVSLGYQYLLTADRAVLGDIKNGIVYGRDLETGLSSRLIRTDYAGLPGRSRHMANLKFFWESKDSRWNANLRLVYRSRWGTSDADGNGIINRPDEYASGYLQANAAAGMKYRAGLSILVGIDNFTNYRDPRDLPGLPGIQPYATLSWSYEALKSKK